MIYTIYGLENATAKQELLKSSSNSILCRQQQYQLVLAAHLWRLYSVHCTAAS
jgi:hypothetical protein